MLSVLLCYATLLDASLLAGEATKVVELSAAHFAVLVDCDRVDERRLDGEDALNTDVVGNLAHSEAFLFAFSGDADNDAAVLLDTLFVAFLDAVSDSDCVARLEIGVLLAGGKGLVDNFN